MLTLTQWRARCERALVRGKFTPKDSDKARDPCHCAIGECAKICNSLYSEIRNTAYITSKTEFKNLVKAEYAFMDAVEVNKPKTALANIKKIERIVNRIRDRL